MTGTRRRPYTVPEIKQISESIGEEFPCRGNFSVIPGHKALLPRVTGKFPLQETSSPILSEICLVFGTVYCLT
jgi:hypothetical protein